MFRLGMGMTYSSLARSRRHGDERLTSSPAVTLHLRAASLTPIVVDSCPAPPPQLKTRSLFIRGATNAPALEDVERVPDGRTLDRALVLRIAATARRRRASERPPARRACWQWAATTRVVRRPPRIVCEQLRRHEAVERHGRDYPPTHQGSGRLESTGIADRLKFSSEVSRGLNQSSPIIHLPSREISGS